MNERHRQILDAVINKAKTKAYEAVDIIGVYGSVASGDCYEKSDLDLLILINGDKGRVLSESFIIQDSNIGYDIYCTTWEMLEADSTCTHPHLSKLLDSKICYSKSEEVLQKLYSLRETTLKRLKSDSRTERSAAELDNAKICFANCFLETELHALRTCMAEVIYHILNAIMLFNGSYFKRGTKRTFDEVSELKLPFDIKGLIMKTILSETADEIRENLKILMKTGSGI